MKAGLKKFAPMILPIVLASLPLITKLALTLAAHHVGSTGYEIPVDDCPW